MEPAIKSDVLQRIEEARAFRAYVDSIVVPHPKATRYARLICCDQLSQDTRAFVADH